MFDLCIATRQQKIRPQLVFDKLCDERLQDQSLKDLTFVDQHIDPLIVEVSGVLVVDGKIQFSPGLVDETFLNGSQLSPLERSSNQAIAEFSQVQF